MVVLILRFLTWGEDFSWTSAIVLVCNVLARQVISIQLVRKYHYGPCSPVFIVFWGADLRPYCTELNRTSVAALLWILEVLLYQKVLSKIRLLAVSDVTSRASGSANFSAEQNRIISLPHWGAIQKMYSDLWSTRYIDEYHRKPCRKWNILSSQEVCVKKLLGPHIEKVLFRQYFPALALNEVVLQSSEIMFFEIAFDVVKFVHKVGWMKFSTVILILSFLKFQVLEFCMPNGF